jgi:hypothetical protein
LLVNISAVVLPTRVSVPTGIVIVLVSLLAVNTGSVRVLLVKVCTLEEVVIATAPTVELAPRDAIPELLNVVKAPVLAVVAPTVPLIPTLIILVKAAHIGAAGVPVFFSKYRLVAFHLIVLVGGLVGAVSAVLFHFSASSILALSSSTKLAYVLAVVGRA